MIEKLPTNTHVSESTIVEKINEIIEKFEWHDHTVMDTKMNVTWPKYSPPPIKDSDTHGSR